MSQQLANEMVQNTLSPITVTCTSQNPLLEGAPVTFDAVMVLVKIAHPHISAQCSKRLIFKALKAQGIRISKEGGQIVCHNMYFILPLNVLVEQIIEGQKTLCQKQIMKRQQILDQQLLTAQHVVESYQMRQQYLTQKASGVLDPVPQYGVYYDRQFNAGYDAQYDVVKKE
ncbi:Hypothetical_protein [Hexamita inflata]|uniref:Hypothetical_protein n=1 Tax=Hexamita inflata TaxID=28002 RepID=A0AA86TYT2_9EUKA|nr:Hypothetical protein HINF_LOCUS21181 [Hexamita inflata]